MFDPENPSWATEVVPGAVMARYSSQGNGGIGDGAGNKTVYTAPSGTTYSWATQLNSTFYYDGYMFVEAGHVYNFFECEYDHARIDVDGTTIIRNTNYGQSSTGSYTATATGWVTIKVWLGGSSGNTGAANGWNYGVGWNDNGTTTASGACTGWNVIENVDGEPVRFAVSPARTPEIVGTSTGVSSATLDVAVPGGASSAMVLAVWNATDLGDSADTNDWAGCAVLGTVGATADTVSGTVSLDPAATPVVRAVVVDVSGVYWSAPVLLGAAVDPVIGSVAAEADGDELSVAGGMVSTGSGNGFALELLVGYGDDAVATATNDVTVAQDGAFSIDAEILPGTNGWWQLVARTSDGGYDATIPAAFATKAGSVLLPSTTSTVSHHTATITATLATLGAGTTTATVWVGDDPSNLVALASSDKVLTAEGSFTIAAKVPGDPRTVYYKVVAVNVAPGTTSWTNETSISTFDTVDAGVYTWKQPVVEGDWDNPDNWTVTGVDADDCLGYPNSSAAQVRFVEGTTATIAVDDKFTFRDMSLKYADLGVTFAGTDAATCELRGDIQNVANDQNDGTLVSNTRIVFSGVTVYDSNGAFNWATKVSTNCVLRLENGAMLSMDNYMHVFGTNTWVEVVGGSQMIWRRLATDQVGFDFCNFAGGLKVDDATFSTAWLTPQRHVSVTGEPQYVLISGARPQVKVGYQFKTYNDSQDWMTNDVVFVYSVPAGGYGDVSAAPFYANYTYGGDNAKRLGWRDPDQVKGGKIVFTVDPKSPAFKTGRTLKHVQLVAWLAGIDEKSVELRDLEDKLGRPIATLYYTYGWPSVDLEPSVAGEAPTGIAAQVVGHGATFIMIR